MTEIVSFMLDTVWFEYLKKISFFFKRWFNDNPKKIIFQTQKEYKYRKK